MLGLPADGGRERSVATRMHSAIGETDLRSLTDDDELRERARALASAQHWPRLGRAGDLYWGMCRGRSNGYEVYLRTNTLASGCTCPSGQRPCKHAVALALVIASGHPIRDAAPPDGLVQRCRGPRYGGSYE